jgi:alpha-1,3-rhamnosyl/mannosyltransferase
MRVVVNQLPALGARTGIGHYTVQLLRCLREQAGTDIIESFPEGWLRGARETFSQMRPYLEGPGQEQRPGGGAPGDVQAGLRSRALGQVRRLGRKLTTKCFGSVCRRRRYDLYHEPNFIPLACDRPTITTLHDLSVLLHPQWHPADRVAHFEMYFKRGLKRSAHFLAISEFCRQEIIKTLHISPDRVTTTYMGIRPGLAPLPQTRTQEALQRLELPGRYLLHVGTIEPRKNILLLLRAYCSLPARLRSCWPLLLVGGWGWNAGAIADFLQHEGKHRGVLHLGYVDEVHLAALYNGARALIYPSLYEGFGLPPAEMMACGGAVICSTAGALVETVGSRACLVHPEDCDAWYQAMNRVLTDDDWWQSLRQGVTTVARAYTWDRCAADTLRVYRKLAGQEQASSTENDLLWRAAG